MYISYNQMFTDMLVKIIKNCMVRTNKNLTTALAMSNIICRCRSSTVTPQFITRDILGAVCVKC